MIEVSVPHRVSRRETAGSYLPGLDLPDKGPEVIDRFLPLGQLAGEELPSQHDRSQWPAMKERFKALFVTKTRDEWSEIFAGTDACVFPVLSTWEARTHPWLQERGTFVEVEGMLQAQPVPRFSRTPGAISKPPSVPGADTTTALSAWGVAEDRIAEGEERPLRGVVLGQRAQRQQRAGRG